MKCLIRFLRVIGKIVTIAIVNLCYIACSLFNYIVLFTYIVKYYTLCIYYY